MLKKNTRKTIAAVLVLCMARTLSAEFEITWHSLDSGGEMVSSGLGFELSGTIGQPDAGYSTVGTYELEGGFWTATEPVLCACPGDINGDTFVDGADIQMFVNCFFTINPPNCECADLDGSPGVNLSDVSVFVNDLLTGPGCP